MPLLTTGAGAYPVAAGGATATWNPSDKNAAFALSNGNLTATGGAGGYVALRATNSRSSGKFYYEVTSVTQTTTGDIEVGLANGTQSLAAFLGNSGSNSAGYIGDNRVFFNGSQVATLLTFTVGDVISVAVDIGNLKIWFRKNAGLWNNSGTDDPATNTGGTNISTINAGPYFPAAASQAASSVFTANFGGSAYAQTPPAGFGNW